jgi:osmoprotectant transport system substrate-binding protein
MRSFRSRALGAALLVVALVATACGSGDGAIEGDGETIVVSSFNFNESTIVAELYAQVLEDRGVSVERQLNLGNREIVEPALSSGEIGLVPEYLGTLTFFLGGTPTADVDESVDVLTPLVEAEGITILEPAPAQDSNGYAVTRATADAYGLEQVSDLSGVSEELVFGGPPECQTRELCLLGLQEVYGLQFAEFLPLDAGGTLTRTALNSGEIDVALVFTTLGWITADDIVVLVDDMGLNPAENLIPAFNAAVLDSWGGPDGDVARALNDVSAALTTEGLTALNQRADIDGVPADEVATDWLVENGFLEADE